MNILKYNFLNKTFKNYDIKNYNTKINFGLYYYPEPQFFFRFRNEICLVKDNSRATKPIVYTNFITKLSTTLESTKLKRLQKLIHPFR